jgi:diamine N-acetyltransferase
VAATHDEPRIRRAAWADSARLAELGARTFRETFGHLYSPADLQHFLQTTRSRDAFEHTLRDPDSAVLLLESGEHAAGYALIGRCKLPVESLEATAGEIQQLYLRTDTQRAGLGSKLLRAAIELLQSSGRAPLYVGVWSQNTGAQRLYERFGFEKVGEYDFPVGAQLDREFILRRG